MLRPGPVYRKLPSNAVMTFCDFCHERLAKVRFVARLNGYSTSAMGA